MPSRAAKGKKRAIEQVLSDAEGSDAASSLRSDTPLSLPAARTVPTKKPKRAETRVCPVCEVSIPLRLLGKHCDLEMERVEEVMRMIGSTEVLADAEPDDGLTSRSRRSAVKTRNTTSSSIASTSEVTLEQTRKMLRAVKRHRKQRHTKLREVTRDEDKTRWQVEGEEGTICPVCQRLVKGDADVVDAHVDACLAHVQLQEEQTPGTSGSGHGDVDRDVDIDGDIEEIRESATAGVSFRGTGFEIRDRAQQDVEDEIDVDGEDEAVFGAPQFTESDILAATSGLHQARSANPPSPSDDGSDLDVGRERETTMKLTSGKEMELKTLRDLVAEGKMIRRRAEVVEDVKRTMEEVMGVGETDRVDQAVEKARREGNDVALIHALESKVNHMVSIRVSSSTSSLCRICLDPYTEPTVSTGCWHTCCRECWLRCLGSTKLCPICKRITAAADLRRIYL
ncbi:hypothetical protein BKA93DRAFT_776680 [Sparassis latifolia]